VKPYVKRHKNDATDAEAICEAVTRSMFFKKARSVAAPDQQSRRCRPLVDNIGRATRFP
jgi:transposase